MSYFDVELVSQTLQGSTIRKNLEGLSQKIEGALGVHQKRLVDLPGEQGLHNGMHP